MSIRYQTQRGASSRAGEKRRQAAALHITADSESTSQRPNYRAKDDSFATKHEPLAAAARKSLRALPDHIQSIMRPFITVLEPAVSAGSVSGLNLE